MKVTLEVANNKAEFLLELLRSLKFVKVTDKRLEDLKNDRVSEHHEVMEKRENGRPERNESCLVKKIRRSLSEIYRSDTR